MFVWLLALRRFSRLSFYPSIFGRLYIRNGTHHLAPKCNEKEMLSTSRTVRTPSVPLFFFTSLPIFHYSSLPLYISCCWYYRKHYLRTDPLELRCENAHLTKKIDRGRGKEKGGRRDLFRVIDHFTPAVSMFSLTFSFPYVFPFFPERMKERKRLPTEME